MKAHDKRGELYNSMTPEEQDQFNEIRKRHPSREHIYWMVDKLTHIGDYTSKFNMEKDITL